MGHLMSLHHAGTDKQYKVEPDLDFDLPDISDLINEWENEGGDLESLGVLPCPVPPEVE